MGFADWVMTLLTSFPVSGLLVGAFLFATRRSYRERQRNIFHEGMNEGRELGRHETLAEVEEMREEKNVGYREASLIIQNKCSACGKKCLHCAKVAKKARKEARAKRIRVENDFHFGPPAEDEEVEARTEPKEKRHGAFWPQF